MFTYSQLIYLHKKIKATIKSQNNFAKKKSYSDYI